MVEKKDGNGLLPAPLEKINQAIADTWEQLGTFKKLQVTKSTILNLCNMGDMPLTGVDIIPTQNGPRLYINHDGAKYNREKYLANQGRAVSSRKVDIVGAKEMGIGADEQHKAQNRVFFRIRTKVRDDMAYRKIVDAIAQAVANGHTQAAEQGLKLLESLESEYQTYSAFSYQSEKFSQNRTPDHILKKGITQACRRADLEISMQVVLPSDEEPVDAEFIVKADAKIKEAQKGASKTELELKPEKVTPGPGVGDEPIKKVGDKTVIVGTPDLGEKTKELIDIFTKAGHKKAFMIKWMTENFGSVKKDELTLEILEKAIAKAKDEFKPETKDKKDTGKKKSDPDRNKIIKKIFASRADKGFDSDDDLRAMVKGAYGKGLSEMDVEQLSFVEKHLDDLAFLVDHKKWGFSTPQELVDYVKDSAGKPFAEMTSQELSTVKSDLDEMI